MVWGLCQFRHSILFYLNHVRIDHAAAVKLFNSKLLTGKLVRWALIIQDFNLTFTFLPSKANVVADALSRHIAILHGLGEGNFKEILRKEQKTDSFCAPIIYYLESGDDTHLPKLPVPLPEFKLEDDNLLRITTLSAKH